MDLIPSVLVYAGLSGAFAGLISLIKPLSFLKIRTRRRGASIAGRGLLLCGAGFLIPASELSVGEPRTRLDEFAPVYEFHEIHSIRVAASRERTYEAIQSVTANEIRFFRTLTWIRRLGRAEPESILNAPEQKPILETALGSGFMLLAEEPNREIVVGTAVAAPPGFRPKHSPTPEDFKAVRRPGFALATMNFLLEDAGPGACVVTTETRIHATDASARRQFAVYWRLIYPGSALIRRMWLRAIKRRAEAADS